MMITTEKVQLRQLPIGAKIKVNPNQTEILVINELDDEVAYCSHFFGIYVLPLERYVYKVA